MKNRRLRQGMKRTPNGHATECRRFTTGAGPTTWAFLPVVILSFFGGDL